MTRFCKSLSAALAVCIVIFAGCGKGGMNTPPLSEGGSNSGESPSSAQESAVLTDRAGNPISLPEKIERIISSAPSNTEILVGLGLGNKLVAIDEFSADVEGIDPNLTKINFRMADPESLIELNPDLIVASGFNSSGGDDPFALIKEAGICVATIPSSNSIQGICDDISFIAQITGTQEKGKEIVEDYLAQVEEIRAKGKTIEDKKRVYFEISPSPDLGTFGADTFLNEFIQIIGAENVFADQTGWILPSAEAVVERNPDVILTNVSYVENAVDEIKSRDGWNAVAAVAENSVYLIDSNPASRPSQFSIKALRQIAETVYPDIYA